MENAEVETEPGYQAVEALIRHMAAHAGEPFDAAALAAKAGWSERQVLRLFRRWAGTTPERFAMYLRAERVKTLLRDSRTLAEAGERAGLSGPQRLHDLVSGFTGLSPAAWKAWGRNARVAWGWADTPLGRGFAAWNLGPEGPEGAVVKLSWSDELTADPFAELKDELPEASLFRDDDGARLIWRRVFSGADDTEEPHAEDKERDLAASRFREGFHLLVHGTDFRIQVWKGLLGLTPGRLVSYGELARLCGDPAAARAVGSAMATNPVAVLIPCHRVLREVGPPTAYRWGAFRKKALLARETAILDGDF